jgi:hypothetical protein
MELRGGETSPTKKVRNITRQLSNQILFVLTNFEDEFSKE